MPVQLEYASPGLARPAYPAAGMLTSTLAVVSSIVIIRWSVQLATAAHMALMVPHDCGTGRHDAENTLYGETPFALIIPVASWLFSRHSLSARLVSRCAVWGAIAGWITAVIFVKYRNVI